MSDCRSSLLQVLPDSFPEVAEHHGLPSVDHCSGAGKLLGEYYARALCEACGICDQDALQILTAISVQMRAYIVLDDFLRDRVVTTDVCEVIKQWLFILQNSVIGLIESLEDKGPDIWAHFVAMYEKGHNSYLAASSYHSTIRKCSFLFLPFHLSIIRRAEAQAKRLKTAVGHYLFSLQLLDDFHDVEEDLEAPCNQNIFTARLSEQSRDYIISGKTALAGPLLDYVADELRAVHSCSCGSQTFDKFLNTGINWLQSKCDEIPDVGVVTPFRSAYEAFHFHDETISQLIPVLLSSPDIDVSMIRAETIHSLLL